MSKHPIRRSPSLIAAAVACAAALTAACRARPPRPPDATRSSSATARTGRSRTPGSTASTAATTAFSTAARRTRTPTRCRSGRSPARQRDASADLRRRRKAAGSWRSTSRRGCGTTPGIRRGSPSSPTTAPSPAGSRPAATLRPGSRASAVTSVTAVQPAHHPAARIHRVVAGMPRPEIRERLPPQVPGRAVTPRRCGQTHTRPSGVIVVFSRIPRHSV